MFWWLTCALCHHEILLLIWDIKFCYSYWTGWNTSWSGLSFPKVPLQLTFNSSSQVHFLKKLKVTGKQSRDLEEGIKGQHWQIQLMSEMRMFWAFPFSNCLTCSGCSKGIFGRCQRKLWLLLLPLSKKGKQNIRMSNLRVSLAFFQHLFPSLFLHYFTAFHYFLYT